jgi:N4-gp56 family major capsid protein
MFKLNIQHFAAGENVHTTSGMAANSTGAVTPYGESGGLSAEMKTYYSDYLIDMAEPKLVHDQFAQKHNIPKNGGKTIEFRKYDPLPKMTTPLTEGVTPNGQKLDMKVISAEVKQYGGFVELSDILLLAAIDNNLVQATKLLGGQAGRTLDTITREVLAGGTNVQYAEGQVESRGALVGGKTEGNHYLTVDAVRKAVRSLKRMNAESINGSYVGIIHPDAAYDLMSDPKWINVKTYSDPEGIYQGEIGKIENVRFVETSEAKIFEGAGADGVDVYATLIIGENAYGTTEISGGGLQHIVKQLGSAGTADPLNQRATAGWKATKAAARLVEPYMVRIETASSFK